MGFLRLFTSAGYSTCRRYAENAGEFFSVYGSIGMLRAQGSPRQPSNCLAPRIA